MNLSEAQKQAIQQLTLQFKARIKSARISREALRKELTEEFEDLSSCRMLAARAVEASSSLILLRDACDRDHTEHLEYIITVLDKVCISTPFEPKYRLAHTGKILTFTI